jgi:hypothetical protein
MPSLFDRNKFIMRCLLHPRKRTCALQLGMSALGHERTFRIAIVMSALPPAKQMSALGHKRTCPNK